MPFHPKDNRFLLTIEEYLNVLLPQHFHLSLHPRDNRILSTIVERAIDLLLQHCSKTNYVGEHSFLYEAIVTEKDGLLLQHNMQAYLLKNHRTLHQEIIPSLLGHKESWDSI